MALREKSWFCHSSATLSVLGELVKLEVSPLAIILSNQIVANREHWENEK